MVKFVTTEKKNSHRRKHELGINQLTSTVTVIWCSPLLYNSGCHWETYRGPSTCSTFDDNGLPSIEIWTDVMSYGENTSNLYRSSKDQLMNFPKHFSYWIRWGQPQMYQRSCCISCTRMKLEQFTCKIYSFHTWDWSFTCSITWKINIEKIYCNSGQTVVLFLKMFRNERTLGKAIF
jgi:hypothetical protein